jgi:hypothetical protein
LGYLNQPWHPVFIWCRGLAQVRLIKNLPSLSLRNLN